MCEGEREGGVGGAAGLEVVEVVDADAALTPRRIRRHLQRRFLSVSHPQRLDAPLSVSLCLATVERSWDTEASQGQIMALA